MLLYQLVTDKVPFEGNSAFDVLDKHRREAPPPPQQVRTELPAPAEAAILKALAKRPEDRFRTAGALAHAFTMGLRGQWVEGLSPTPASVAPTLPEFVPQRTLADPATGRGRTARTLRRTVLISAVAIFMVAGSIATVLAARGGFNPQTTGNRASAGPQATSTPSPTDMPLPTGTPSPRLTNTAVPRPTATTVYRVLPTATATTVPPTATAPPPPMQVTVLSCLAMVQPPTIASVMNLRRSIFGVLFGGIHPADPPFSGSGLPPYPPLNLQNVGSSTLIWIGSTDNPSYTISPANGNLNPGTTTTVRFSGLQPGPGPLNVVIDWGTGRWSQSLSPC